MTEVEIFDLVLHPDQRLRLQSEPFEVIDQGTVDLSQKMIETMHSSKGVGLAGVQVGVMKNIFVAEPEEGKPQVFINPKIVAYSDETDSYEEGCLSIPGVFSNVRRPTAIQITAYDPQGKPLEMEIDGFLARIFQHEYDHLVGKLFFDHLGNIRRRKLLKAYGQLRGVSEEDLGL